MRSVIGCVWIGFLLAFVLFFKDYRKYYRLGVIEGKKGSYLLYQDLDKRARKIALAFLMFLGMTYCFVFVNQHKFIQILLRGGLIAVAVIPALNKKYGNSDRYAFSRVWS